MYSHYIGGIFSPLNQQNNFEKTSFSSEKQSTKRPIKEQSNDFTKIFSGIAQRFSFNHFDTGDVLLVLIILFLFLEGDNLELVITLGLMLFLGLGDDQSTS